MERGVGVGVFEDDGVAVGVVAVDGGVLAGVGAVDLDDVDELIGRVVGGPLPFPR